MNLSKGGVCALDVNGNVYCKCQNGFSGFLCQNPLPNSLTTTTLSPACSQVFILSYLYNYHLIIKVSWNP
jgi:hypothetical protein